MIISVLKKNLVFAISSIFLILLILFCFKSITNAEICFPGGCFDADGELCGSFFSQSFSCDNPSYVSCSFFNAGSGNSWTGSRCIYRNPDFPYRLGCASDGDSCNFAGGCCNPNAACVAEGGAPPGAGFCVTNYSDNPPPTISCGSQGGYCPAGGGTTCRGGFTPNANAYECANVCCLPTTCANVNGRCVNGLNGCPNGYTHDPNGYASLDNSCTGGTDTCCQPYGNFSACTNGSTGVCNATSPGTNTCGTYAGTQSYNYNGTQPCNPTSGTKFCTTVHQNNCNAGAGYTCNDPNNGTVCITSIFVHVYTDYSHTQSNNGGKGGVNVSVSGHGSQSSDGSGNTTFGGLSTGNYTVSESVPANFQAVNASSQGVSLTNNAGNVTVNFYLTPLYSISGRVFTDINKNQKYDGNDSGYGGGTIHITGGPTAVADITAAGDGTWTTPTNLESGTYTVSYTTSLATGYTFTTPSSFTVTVGNPAGSPACNTGSSLDATCGGTNSGSIGNVDIGLTNENSWLQSACLDVRDDSGTYTNLIPASPSCGGVTGAYASITNAQCTSGPGIIFTCNATGDFGLGSANANNWTAGDSSNNECFTGTGLDIVRTSYNYLFTTAQQSNITPTDMSDVSVCGGGGLNDCILPANLPKGIYIANSDLHLDAASYTFPVDASIPQAFIFLINGNLYINGNILVPAGSVAAFSAKGDINIASGVGNSVSDVNDPAVNNPNIEGLYSADGSFIIHSVSETNGGKVCQDSGLPVDNKLNIVGSVVTNAAQGGGTLTNNRDLCIYDTSCSSLSYGDGLGLSLSYILTLYGDGGFLNHQLFNWQELRP